MQKSANGIEAPKGGDIYIYMYSLSGNGKKKDMVYKGELIFSFFREILCIPLNQYN